MKYRGQNMRKDSAKLNNKMLALKYKTNYEIMRKIQN